MVDFLMPTLYEQIEEAFDNGMLDTTYPPSVYEAYLKAREMSFEHLMDWPQSTAHDIADYYVGYFASRRDFIDEYITGVCGVQIPSTLVIDYEATWQSELRHSYDFVLEDGEREDSGKGWYFQQH